MIWAITFSNQNYKRSAKLNEISAKVFGGADKTIIYSPNDFDEKFVESKRNQKMLSFLNVVFHSIKNAIEVDMKRESDIVYITDKYSVRGEVRTYHVLAA